MNVVCRYNRRGEEEGGGKSKIRMYVVMTTVLKLSATRADH